MKITPEDTRTRLVAAVSMMSILLPVNPKSGLVGICKQVGCANIGPELIKLGVVRNEGTELDPSYKWLATDAPDKIVDQLILARRLVAERLEQTPVPGARVTALEQKVKEQESAIRALIEQVNKTQIPAIPADVKLCADDRELIDMMINDHSALKSMVLAMDANLTELMKRAFGSQPARDQPLAALAIPRKWRVGIIGIFDRDVRHVEDAIKAGLNGQAKHVELIHIDHSSSKAPSIPARLDAVVVTDIGFRRGQDAAVTYPGKIYNVRGGLNSLSAQIITIVTGKL